MKNKKNTTTQELSSKREVELRSWPRREHVLLDVLRGKTTLPLTAHATCSTKDLIAYGYEDPDHPCAPKTAEEFEFIEELKRADHHGSTSTEQLILDSYSWLAARHDQIADIKQELSLPDNSISPHSRSVIDPLLDDLLKETDPDGDENPIILLGNALKNRHNKSTRGVQERANQNRQKILTLARKLDPSREMSANRLAGLIYDELCVTRKTTTAKTTDGKTLTKKDTSYALRGLKKTSIYNTLRELGW